MLPEELLNGGDIWYGILELRVCIQKRVEGTSES
jgi:hypothetical protein